MSGVATGDENDTFNDTLGWSSATLDFTLMTGLGSLFVRESEMRTLISGFFGFFDSLELDSLTMYSASFPSSLSVSTALRRFPCRSLGSVFSSGVATRLEALSSSPETIALTLIFRFRVPDDVGELMGAPCETVPEYQFNRRLQLLFPWKKERYRSFSISLSSISATQVMLAFSSTFPSFSE